MLGFETGVFAYRQAGPTYTGQQKLAPESDKGLEMGRMTRIVFRIFSRHHLSSQPLMSRAVAEARSSDPSFWQARAAQARRIASMLLGRDAQTVLAYAQECDERGRALSAKATASPSGHRVPRRRAGVEPFVGRQASSLARRKRRSLLLSSD
jgi:hypothetical protein